MAGKQMAKTPSGFDGIFGGLPKVAPLSQPLG